MEWKDLLWQSGAMLLAVVVGMKFFGPLPPASTPPLRDSVQASLHALEGRLDTMIEMLAQQRPPGPRPSDGAASSLNTEEIHRTLRTIVATLSRLETTAPPMPPPHASPGGSPWAREPEPRPPPPVPPMAWMQELPEATRQQVDEIFQEHAILLREKMAVASEGGRPPLEALHTIMEETNEEMKTKLKAILPEEAYRNFLDSLPPPPPVPQP